MDEKGVSLALSPEPRRVVASRSKATALVEQIAAKHGVTVHAVMLVRWQREAVAATAEVAFELKHKMGWSLRAIGQFLNRNHNGVCTLLTVHEKNMRLARRFMPTASAHALVQIEGDARLTRMVDAEERAAYAESELSRLSGNIVVHLAETLQLGNRLRCVILLAVIAEAYPRTVPGPDLLELYDEACERVGYGTRRGVTFNLMTKNVQHLREHFVKMRWPDPLHVAERGSLEAATGARRLTDGCARFLHARLGVPKLSQIEAAGEKRSGRVPRGVAGLRS